MKSNSFRFTLRNQTQQAHQRLDDALIEYDLTTVTGLRSYLCVHFLARQHLQCILNGYEFLRDDTEKLISLKADFNILNVKSPTWKAKPDTGSYHPLGIIYVLTGSSLGSKLLYKNWNAGTDPSVLKVKNFMISAKDSQLWNDFLKHVEKQTFSQIETDEIIDAANYCFGVFEAANHQISESQ